MILLVEGEKLLANAVTDERPAGAAHRRVVFRPPIRASVADDLVARVQDIVLLAVRRRRLLVCAHVRDRIVAGNQGRELVALRRDGRRPGGCEQHEGGHEGDHRCLAMMAVHPVVQGLCGVLAGSGLEHGTGGERAGVNLANSCAEIPGQFCILC